MSCGHIATRGKFEFTRDRIEQFMDEYFPESELELHEMIEELGWSVTRTRKTGIT